MAGLDPAIHVILRAAKTWMPGASPGMTKEGGIEAMTCPPKLNERRRKQSILPCGTMDCFASLAMTENQHVVHAARRYF